MINKIAAVVVIIAALSLIGCSSEQYAQNSRGHLIKRDTLRMMTQQDVISLSKAGLSDSLIISMMEATDTWFQLKPQNVIDLKNAGVNDKVIQAMMEQPATASAESNNTRVEQYYMYPPYWYDGFYPYWYYPRFSVRFGFHPYHHRRFR